MTPVSSNTQQSPTNTAPPLADTEASRTSAKIQRFIIPEGKGLNSSMCFESVTDLDSGEITHTDRHKTEGVTKYREFSLELPGDEERTTGSALDGYSTERLLSKN